MTRVTKRPEPWTEEQATVACNIMKSFSDKKTLAAVMECDEADLDSLCSDAYGMDYATASDHFAAVGRGMLQSKLFDMAVNDGNPKAIDMLARKYLGLDPIATRTKAQAKAGAEEKVVPF